MQYVFMDLETFSRCDLRKCGAHRYAEDPTTEVLLWGYAVGEEPARVWDVASGAPMPDDLRQALDDVAAGKAKTVWHNGMNFDATVLRALGYADLAPEDVIDTMVLAYQCALPGSLADLSAIFRMDKDHAKDSEGRKLDRATAKTHPEEWARFVNYCRLDVEAERVLFKRLPKFNVTPAERALQCLDARINNRGMQIDLELAHVAVELSLQDKNALKSRVSELTDGRVASASQVQAMLEEIERQFGFKLKNLQRSEVDRLIEMDSIPEPMRELLRVRLATAKSSVTKFKAMIAATCKDGRLRGALQFRGASRTGRYSGRLLQPQNLPRPTIKSNEEIEFAIGAAKDGTLPLFYPGEVAATLSNCLRGAITVAPGKKMVVADYSNIEGRVLAWLVGEAWKLDAFRAYDAGTGHDLYKLTYSKAFNVPVESVTKAQRQMGKVLELAMGYGGGAGAFVTFAKGYGIDLHEMADAVLPVVPAAVMDEAVRGYEWAREKPARLCGLSRDVWLACDSVKRLWRRANPHIVNFWKALGEACIVAIKESRVVRVKCPRPMTVERRGSWLLIRLPSGRFLCYASPRAVDGESDAWTYMGVNQRTRKWERLETYGGKLVENVTQAIAADVLTAALPRLEQAGFQTILTIHDEVLTECPDEDEFTHARMEEIMCELPPWAEGLPLAAAGFESYRYHK